MRQLIVSINVTLDGYMAGPNCELDWHFQSWTSEMARAQCDQLSRADTILLGAVTYRAMASYWPAVTVNEACARDDLAFADMMNRYQKIVYSRSLNMLSWDNSSLIKGNLRKEVLQLKEQPGRDIVVYGSGKLVSALMNYELVDRYVLWMHPVVLGKGKPLFKQVKDRLNMRLDKVEQFASGVLIMHYSPA
jgi:dihydrofolate reductase